MKKSIMVCGAHPDDDMLGAGGTLAKYHEEGYHTTAVIFSYGELSHPWVKSKVTREIRTNEAKRAHEVVGCDEGIFFGLKEGNFKPEIKQKKIEDVLRKIIRQRNPKMIFTHSFDDPHPDHHAVYETVLKVVDSIKGKHEVYTFDIWNPMSVRRRYLPRLYVDVSRTFGKKIAALRCYKSQIKYIFHLIISVYVKAIKAGIENNCRFAESFYKER